MLILWDFKDFTYVYFPAPFFNAAIRYHRFFPEVRSPDLDLGFPIATGVIEGACRHLVKDRMDITGAKWRLASAEAVLRLRALRSSNDFDDYWKFHEAREYQRNHQALYKNCEVPLTNLPQHSPRYGHLRVMKFYHIKLVTRRMIRRAVFP